MLELNLQTMGEQLIFPTQACWHVYLRNSTVTGSTIRSMRNGPKGRVTKVFLALLQVVVEWTLEMNMHTHWVRFHIRSPSILSGRSNQLLWITSSPENIFPCSQCNQVWRSWTNTQRAPWGTEERDTFCQCFCGGNMEIKSEWSGGICTSPHQPPSLLIHYCPFHPRPFFACLFPSLYMN